MTLEYYQGRVAQLHAENIELKDQLSLKFDDWLQSGQLKDIEVDIDNVKLKEESDTMRRELTNLKYKNDEYRQKLSDSAAFNDDLRQQLEITDAKYTEMCKRVENYQCAIKMIVADRDDAWRKSDAFKQKIIELMKEKEWIIAKLVFEKKTNGEDVASSFSSPFAIYRISGAKLHCVDRPAVVYYISHDTEFWLDGKLCSAQVAGEKLL